MDFRSEATSHFVARFGWITPFLSHLTRVSKKIVAVGPPQLGFGPQPILEAGKKGSPYLRVPPYLGVTEVGAGLVVVGAVVVFAGVLLEAQPVKDAKDKDATTRMRIIFNRVDSLLFIFYSFEIQATYHGKMIRIFSQFILQPSFSHFLAVLVKIQPY
jgi:hypothetical protein